MRWVVIPVFLVTCVGVCAEEPEHPWRIGVSLGGRSPQAEIESDAANVLSLFSREGEVQFLFIDPRPDAARFGTLAIQPGAHASVSAQYTLNRTFSLEASLGYSRAELGDVEIHVQFATPDAIDDIGFAFETVRIPAGDVELLPAQLSGVARFRPAAPLKPYAGAGIGYQIAGFEPTSEFDTFSRRLDNSLAVQGRLIPGTVLSNPNPQILVSPNAIPEPLTGAQVEVEDSFTWHVLAGLEYAVSPRWALTFDFRYAWSSRAVTIGFNGGEDLGLAVPQGSEFVDSGALSRVYGPVFVSEGGLLDGGSRVPRPQFPPDTDCRLEPIKCFFDRDTPDGIPDTGFYYVNGGQIDHEAFHFSIGLHYAF